MKNVIFRIVYKVCDMIKIKENENLNLCNNIFLIIYFQKYFLNCLVII